MEVAFVGIPFYTLAKYRPMALAVRHLREASITEKIRRVANSFSDLGDVDCPGIVQDHGSKNLRNFQEFLEGTRRVKSKLAGQSNPSKLTFCLGGECAFVPGALAGLKTVYKGNPGMVWLDAHGDFNTPETTPSGFIGGMPLALACGRGPKLAEEVESSRPVLDEKRVVHVGSRSLDPGEDEALRESVKLFSATELKKQGADHVALQIARFLADKSDWIVAHLDVDVFDPSIMPGIDFPEPGGLSGPEVLEIFRALHATGKLKVVDLTAYNPLRDKTRQGESLLMDLAPRLVK
ncbi:MAG TPA: arginase family protein [Candidatus Bathyarchaeia archaeon]|jgi:arginase|nr:arginase family protein [Candidatus Bathyarchaeia archaeon]